MARPVDILRFMARSGKRIIVSVVGGVFVLGGLAMLVLPGPGILVVAIGFAILGTEYAWAANALEKTKHVAAETGTRVKRGVRAVPGSARRLARRRQTPQ